MEKQLKLKTTDEHIIYGTLTTGAKPSKVLAVFVHGLTGHPNEHSLFNAARMFPKMGVDVFRFALYTGEKDGRNLSDCTIATHSTDLDQVVKHFRKKYGHISVIGHSLGSPAILKADTNGFDSIVLWDPSYLANARMDLLKQVKIDGRQLYIQEWGTEYLMSPAMLEEWSWFNGENELTIVANLRKPLKIIVAKKGVLVPGSKKYYKVAQEPKELTIIPGATHCFDEEGVEEVLLSQTLQWIKKHSR